MASNEPPDEGSGRPPISSFDVPIDESGADEVERKREQRRNEAALPVAAIEALKLKGLGFSILPLPTEKKFPPPKDWEKASQNNPAVFLKNPGTNNYAVLPPPGCFGWDIDKDAPALVAELEAKLGGLPLTLTTRTPNGEHLFYRWPDDLARPKGQMFGAIVTRWPLGEGQGYLVGPGSVVVQDNGTLGAYYGFGDAVADLPRAWAQAALDWRAPREVKTQPTGPLAVVGPHYELPESVPPGGRYDAIRDYVASRYNKNLSVNEMWGGVQAELAPRFSEPLTTKELKERFERTVRDIEDRLGPPVSAPVSLNVGETGAESDTPSQAPGEGKVGQPLFVDSTAFAAELRQREPISYLVPGWVPAAGLTVLAGHPKSMKSLALLQMLGAFVAGTEWLGENIGSSTDVRVGLYLTREGSHSEMLKRVDALLLRHGPLLLGTRLRFAYEQPIEFDAPSYARVSVALAELESEMSVLPGRLRVLLALDPLRDLMPADGDENEAKTMAVVKRWCRSLIADFGFVSIVLVHHLRKSASGQTGLEMSGSGAVYGAVDSTIIWQAKKEDVGEDDDTRLVSVAEMFGKYRVETRGDAPFVGRWRYDADAELIVPGVGRVETATGRAVPGTGRSAVLEAIVGCGTVGSTVKGIADMVGISEANARVQLNRLEQQGAVVQEAGRRYGAGLAPHQQPNVILPMAEEAGGEPADDPDSEVWVDPLHRLD